MNRIIKFRAWDKKSGKMIKSFAHVGKNGRMYTIHHEGYEPDYEVMQFTGLTDKNGVDIYEGDIVRAIAKETHKDSTEQATDIVWSELQWQVRSPGYQLGLPMTWGGWESLEVIGNIYETPELLEGGVK